MWHAGGREELVGEKEKVDTIYISDEPGCRAVCQAQAQANEAVRLGPDTRKHMPNRYLGYKWLLRQVFN